MKKFPCIFEVQSRYPFPPDMLRYDSCYPVDATSADQIARSFADQPLLPRDARFTVRLKSEHLPHGPTVARWESFLWKVVDVVDEL